MTIILPQDCVAGWQRALNADTSMHWDMLAGDLVRHAADEPDRGVRDDILTLALVACERAAGVWRTVEAMQRELDLEEATRGAIDLEAA